jgi:hypothetical protein
MGGGNWRIAMNADIATSSQLNCAIPSQGRSGDLTLVLKDLKENNALGRLANASQVSAMMRNQSVNQADLTSKIAHDFTSL